MDSANNLNDNNYGSKRKKFLNILKNTKETYIPQLSSGLAQLKDEASNNFFNKNTFPKNNNTDINDGLVKKPKILTYGTYSAYNENRNMYLTTITGSVIVEGIMNRKNRLIYSLCKKLIKDPDTTTIPLVEKDIKSLENEGEGEGDGDGDLDSFTRNSYLSSSIGSTSSLSSLSSKDTIIEKNDSIFNKRISAFLSKGVPYRHLIINSDVADPVYLTTDASGSFCYILQTNDIPEKLKISLMSEQGDMNSFVNDNDDSNDNNSINTENQEVDIPMVHYSQTGIGIISDIDDTIKHTGILENKKSIFTNTFVQTDEVWSIPSMANWYKFMKFKYKCEFFYVSNSPIQLYDPLNGFISRNYPRGVMYLKEYSAGGNLITNLMTSSAKRKLNSIIKIVQNFPEKKFMLIGDSGEHDLEAYIEVCKQFPTQILAVYIRCTKGSMTDYNVNEEDGIIAEFNKLIENSYWCDKKSNTVGKVNFDLDESSNILSPPPLPVRLGNNQSNNLNENMCTPPIVPPRTSLDQQKKKVPPPVPRKNPNLSTKVDEILKTQEQNISMSSNSSTEEQKQSFVNDTYITPSSNDDYGTYDQFFDRRVDNWRYRILDALDILESVHTRYNHKIQLSFFKEECLEQSQKIIEKNL